MSDDRKSEVSEAARAMARVKTPRRTQVVRESLAESPKKRWEDPAASERFGGAIREAVRRRRGAVENDGGSV